MKTYTTAIVALFLSVLPSLSTAQEITEAYMRGLGEKAATGDLKAVDAIEKAATRLYADIDWDAEDDDRLNDNLPLMTAALTPIGKAASGTNSAPAMKALRYAAQKWPFVQGFVPDALGIAAAKGNQEALDMLVDYEKSGFLESSVVFALQGAAEAGKSKAVQFMIDVLKDPGDTAIWHVAESSLTKLSKVGHEGAKAALQEHEKRKGSQQRPQRDK